MINFSEQLNAEQLKVVEHGDGPCLVLAGAGSGKTRAITYRVAYLLEQGVDPKSILLVTFTNKAADEMKSRVQQLTGSAHTLPWSGTFHHIGYRILRQYAPLLGYQNNFSVLDNEDSNALIKLCIKQVKPDTKGKRFPSAKVLNSIISFTRNAEITLEEVIDLRHPQWLSLAPDIKEIAKLYEHRKKLANAMDFDDLLVNLLILLNNEKVVNKFAQQFRYVLVDEYQDTNKIQASIIKRFASVHKNILVVGDDAQSIYSFRAADISNILNFEKEYPGAEVFKLETNYRSSQEILDVANSVIENNNSQYPKKLKTIRNKEPLPVLQPSVDQETEAIFIVREIEKLLGAATEPAEISVLFRAAFHSQMLEMQLVKANIAYDYRGGVRFFERAHVKDILSYLRIFSNPADAAAWLRVLLHEEGIGPAAAEKIIEQVSQVDQVNQVRQVQQVRQVGEDVLGEKARVGWNNFIRIWRTMLDAPDAKKLVPAILIESLIQSPYREYLEAEYVDSSERLADIKQLAVFAQKYESLEEFLAEATLQESFSMVADNPSLKGDKKNKIVLSTIHQAKGLEWKAVFIINLAKGGFPSDRALSEENGLEEERRLFYVAVTRAKEKLWLTYPLAGGFHGNFLSGPSMFLDEVNPGLLDDHSFLSTNATVLNDPDSDIEYIPEAKPFTIRPGSLLKDIEDL